MHIALCVWGVFGFFFFFQVFLRDSVRVCFCLPLGEMLSGFHVEAHVGRLL